MTMPAPPHTHPTPRPTAAQEIRIYSHCSLFYWWPVWLFGFVFALWTLTENHLVGFFPRDTKLQNVEEVGANTVYTIEVPTSHLSRSLKDAKDRSERQQRLFPTRVSEHSWMGAIFVIVLLLVTVITNVPLRGLWSVLTIGAVVLLVVLLALFDVLGTVATQVGNLTIYINFAGYLFIALALFIVWLVTVMVFDKQVYMVFTPGQLRVCLEIGGGETAYDTMGMVIQKQRDDLFRHWVLGLGSGDLTVRTAGAQAHEFQMQNVLFVGTKLNKVMEMQRDRPTVQGHV